MKRLSATAAIVLTLAATTLATLCVAPATAVAQENDDEMARQLFQTGRAYFDRAQYAEAAEAFGEAYRLSGRAELLVNQARALESAGDTDGAIAALERAETELSPESSTYPSIAPRLHRLRAQQAHEAENAQTDPETTAEEAVAEETQTEALSEDPAPPLDDGPGTLFWVGIGTAGLGAALLVTSLATGLAAHGVHNDLVENCPGDVCPPEYAGDIDKGSALAAASTATLFIGLAAAAVGVTLIFLDDGGGDESAEGASAQLRLGPGSVLVDGRF